MIRSRRGLNPTSIQFPKAELIIRDRQTAEVYHSNHVAPHARSWWTRAILFALAAWIGLWAVEATPAIWVHQYFSGPAAHLAGLLLGVPVIDSADAERLFWLLPHPVLDLHVGRECSGMNFFLVALLLLVWGFPWPRLARDSWPLLAFIPLAYLFTLLANGLRLAAVFQSRILAEWLLPPQFFSLVHLMSGGLVFLTILILLHILHESFQQSRSA